MTRSLTMGIRVTPDERRKLERIAQVLTEEFGEPTTLSGALRSVNLNALSLPREGDRAPQRPRGFGKNFGRTEYLKEHPEMAGTRRRAPEAT
jgi:hypothetical protein